VGVPQSVVIFGVLIFLFIVYITQKGQLASYGAILGLGGSSSTTSTTPQATNSSTTATPSGSPLINASQPLNIVSNLNQPLTNNNISSDSVAALGFNPYSSSATSLGLGNLT